MEKLREDIRDTTAKLQTGKISLLRLQQATHGEHRRYENECAVYETLEKATHSEKEEFTRLTELNNEGFAQFSELESDCFVLRRKNDEERSNHYWTCAAIGRQKTEVAELKDAENNTRPIANGTRWIWQRKGPSGGGIATRWSTNGTSWQLDDRSCRLCKTTYRENTR